MRVSTYIYIRRRIVFLAIIPIVRTECEFSRQQSPRALYIRDYIMGSIRPLFSIIVVVVFHIWSMYIRAMMRGFERIF